MLTRYERKLLKYCSKHKYQSHFETNKFEPKFYETFNQNEIKSVCESLKSKDYIGEMSLTIYQDVRFNLSHKGVHYKEVSWLEIKEFLTKSIITPIIVSLITSLVTFFLFS